jgi:hypothetical protein
VGAHKGRSARGSAQVSRGRGDDLLLGWVWELCTVLHAMVSGVLCSAKYVTVWYLNDLTLANAQLLHCNMFVCLRSVLTAMLFHLPDVGFCMPHLCTSGD